MLDVHDFHELGWRGTADRAALHKDPTTTERKKKLQPYLKGLPVRSKILDFGCGRGEFTNYIASLGYDVVGADISSVAVELNRKDYPNLKFAEITPGQQTPFAAGTFDVIWASEVIEHVYDVHGVFAEFTRLLNKNGRLILTTPYHGWLKNLLVVTFGFERHFNVEWQHIRFWTKRSLTQVAGKHTLKPLVWETIGRISWLAKSYFVVFELTTV